MSSTASLPNDDEDDDLRSSYHRTHCLNCINLKRCNSDQQCPIVSCPNQCDFKLHECKLGEHLSETCPYETIDCVNRTNGCQARFKRFDLTHHLLRCPANVVRCSSFSTRLIKNNKSPASSSQNALKWPDPIKEEKLKSKESENKNTTINDVFLGQDYKHLRAFAKEFPLKFQRMYGYIIGLKLDNLSNNSAAQQNKFLFMRYLLKNVRSRIFKDIESENCVVFNDELGCAACQVRIRMLEMKRFSQMKEKYTKTFDPMLRDVESLSEFVERKIYLDEKFLDAYDEIYMPEDKRRAEEEEMRRRKEQQLSPETNRELYDELLKRNDELIEAIELDPTLKLNVAKELPCEIFQMQYETYRTKDTEFATDCDQLLRRDEYNEHYSFYHNNLMPNCDFIETKCPLADYGCPYFSQRIDFSLSCSLSHSHPVRLGFNDTTSTFVFNLDSDQQSQSSSSSQQANSYRIEEEYSYRKNYWDLDVCTNEPVNGGANSSSLNLLDLPFEVLYEIITHLDSNSLFNLSLTSKAMRKVCKQFLQLRGIIYPKWVKSIKKEESNDNDIIEASRDDNNNEKEEMFYIKKKSPIVKWSIEKYVYSYSKHIKTPNEVKMTTNMKSAYYEHLKNCPFKVVQELPKRVKIFPPFN